MNLALHQLRLELRRERAWLAFYALVLLCNYGVALGWIGGPEPGSSGQWQGVSPVPVLLAIGFWGLVARLVTAVVLDDSPARRNRFLATRPMPGVSLFLGKALFVLLAVILPAVLMEALSLAASGAPTALASTGALERFVHLCLIAGLLAAFAAHWARAQAMLIAAAAGFGALAIIANLLAVAAPVAGSWAADFERDITPLAILQGAVVMTLGMAVTAWVRSRYGWRLGWAAPSFVTILLAGIIATAKTPFRSVPLRGESQEEIDRLAADDPVRIGRYRFSSSAPWSGSADIGAKFSVEPAAGTTADDYDWRWKTLSERWSAGVAILKTRRSDAHLPATDSSSSDRSSIRWSVADAIRQVMGDSVAYVGRPDPGRFSSPVTAGHIRYDPDRFPAGEQAVLESVLAADLFRWKVAANLPVMAGSSEGGWQVAGIHQSTGTVRIAMQEKTVSLHTARSVHDRPGRQRWRIRKRFALCFPDRGVAVIGRPSHEDEISSLFTARRSIGHIVFGEPGGGLRDLFSGDLSEARLLVLEDAYLGRLTTSWISPGTVLASEPTERDQPSTPGSDRLGLTEFNGWFDNWEKLSPVRERSKVHRHLDELLRQVSLVSYSMDRIEEPSLLYTSGFVPRHLEWMLARLPALDSRTRSFLATAIGQGAREGQRDAILRSALRHEEMTGVAVSRGWLRDSPETALELLRTRGLDEPGVMAAIVASDNPDLDGTVFDAYRCNPSDRSYEMLRQVPRLAEETERITTGFWKPGRIMPDRHDFDTRFSLALLQGRTEALEELFVLVRIANVSKAWNVSNLVGKTIRLPHELRRSPSDHEAILRWVRDRSADDFSWDPVFRQFVLKDSPPTT